MSKNLARQYRELRTNRLLSYVACKHYSKDIQNKKDEVTKEALQWRASWDQERGHWYSKLKVFSSDHNNTDIIRFLQSPIDLRPSTLKKWWQRKQEEVEAQTQQYIPERNEILGDDLAAAHFIIFRGGSVQFHGEDWLKADDENLKEKLPNVYVPGKTVKAIDCSNMNLFYEGLSNLKGLNLQWLRLYNCKNIDDWCLDRISGTLRNSLNFLDLRKCPKVTDRGIGALYRMEMLKTLVLDDYKKNKSLELTCLMLQELLPNLEIISE